MRSEALTVAQQVDTNAPLGKGGFGTVYKALNLQTGDFVAIKQIRLLQIPQDQLAGFMVRPRALRPPVG